MQLKMQVQSERLVLMLAFMIDFKLHEVLKGVSERLQADKTTLADVGQRVEFAIENITNCAQNCGQLESSARRFSKTGKGPWANGSLKIDPCSEAEIKFQFGSRIGIAQRRPSSNLRRSCRKHSDSESRVGTSPSY